MKLAKLNRIINPFEDLTELDLERKEVAFSGFIFYLISSLFVFDSRILYFVATNNLKSLEFARDLFFPSLIIGGLFMVSILIAGLIRLVSDSYLSENYIITNSRLIFSSTFLFGLGYFFASLTRHSNILLHIGETFVAPFSILLFILYSNENSLGNRSSKLILSILILITISAIFFFIFGYFQYIHFVSAGSQY